MTFNRRSLLVGATALGGTSFLPNIAHAKGSIVATTYPGTWEDAYRAVVMPMLKKKDDIDLELAPLFAIFIVMMAVLLVMAQLVVMSSRWRQTMIRPISPR